MEKKYILIISLVILGLTLIAIGISYQVIKTVECENMEVNDFFSNKWCVENMEKLYEYDQN